MVPSDFQSNPKPSGDGLPDADEIRDYYAILNLDKNASNSEIRQSYFRLKNTYNHSNQALYSLLEEDDLHDSLNEIREAYDVLIDPERRMDYDQILVATGLAKRGDLCKELHRPSGNRISQKKDSYRTGPDYDRQSESNDGRRGSYPKKNYEVQPLNSRQAAESEPARKIRYDEPSAVVHGGCERDSIQRDLAPNSTFIEMHKPGARKLIATKAMDSGIQRKIQDLIEEGDPGDGALFKKIRVLVGVSQEEMQDHIKISIGYIKNLEENCFDLLPQEVYVKGFLKSYLRFLGVPGGDKLVNAYAERIKSWAESGRT